MSLANDIDGIERPSCLPKPPETPAKQAARQVLERMREIFEIPNLTGPQAAVLLYTSGLVPRAPESPEQRRRRLQHEAFAEAEWRRMVSDPNFQPLIRVAGPG